MPVLKALVGGQWVDVGTQGPAGPAGAPGAIGPTGPTGPDEVFAGTAAPVDPLADLWIDTTNPAAPVLKSKDAGGLWIPLTTPVPNEVFIGPDAPVDPDVELWVDEDAVGAAPAAGGEEIHVGTDDPYVTDPASTVEMWFDPTPTEKYVNMVIEPNPAPIGVTATATVRNLTPGATYKMYDSATSSEVTSAPLSGYDNIADANGVCVWTLTWLVCSSSGNNQIDIQDAATATNIITDQKWYCA